MNETIVTVVGNVVTDPQTRMTQSGKVFVTFRIAATERRFHSAAGAWRDGETLYLGVTAWRALAENTANSLGKGEPVIVRGRLRGVEWEKDGQRRTSYEIEAYEIGHDLNRGTTTFAKTRKVSPDREEADVALESADDGGNDPAAAAVAVVTQADRPPTAA